MLLSADAIQQVHRQYISKAALLSSERILPRGLVNRKRMCSRQTPREGALLCSSLFGTDQRLDLPKGRQAYWSRPFPRPIATIAAAIAHRLIVRIRNPPRA